MCSFNSKVPRTATGGVESMENVKFSSDGDSDRHAGCIAHQQYLGELRSMIESRVRISHSLLDLQKLAVRRMREAEGEIARLIAQSEEGNRQCDQQPVDSRNLSRLRGDIKDMCDACNYYGELLEMSANAEAKLRMRLAEALALTNR
jgi:hypothetical protein